MNFSGISTLGAEDATIENLSVTTIDETKVVLKETGDPLITYNSINDGADDVNIGFLGKHTSNTQVTGLVRNATDKKFYFLDTPIDPGHNSNIVDFTGKADIMCADIECDSILIAGLPPGGGTGDAIENPDDGLTSITASNADTLEHKINSVQKILTDASETKLSQPLNMNSNNITSAGTINGYTLSTFDSDITSANNHILDATLHRSIEDLAPSSTGVYSSSKIETELATKAMTGHNHVVADITDYATNYKDRIQHTSGLQRVIASSGGVGVQLWHAGSVQLTVGGDSKFANTVNMDSNPITNVSTVNGYDLDTMNTTIEANATGVFDNDAQITINTPAIADRVVGPSSATNDSVARFDLTTGKLIQDSALVITDTGSMTLTPTGGNGLLSLKSGTTQNTQLRLWDVNNVGYAGWRGISGGSQTQSYVMAMPAARPSGSRTQCMVNGASDNMTWVTPIRTTESTPLCLDNALCKFSDTLGINVVNQDSIIVSDAGGLTFNGTTTQPLALKPYGVGSGETSSIAFYNLADTKYIGIKAPDTVTANYTVSLPEVAPTVDQVLSASSATSLEWTTTRKITTASTLTYTVLVSDIIVHSTYSTTGAQTITLPDATTFAAGQVLHIKDGAGNASVFNITIDTTSSQTIDGSLTFVLSGNYSSVSIYANGSSWFVY